MIKLLTLIILTSSSTAWASKARLIALGQDANGSHIIADDRNIFLNPAYVNKVKRSVNGEWGNTTLVPSPILSTSTLATPQAEGGIVNTHESFNSALQLGRQTDISTQILQANQLFTQTFIIPENSIDVIFGTDLAGTLAGIGLHIATTTEENAGTGGEDEAQAITLYGGMLKDNMGGYVNIDVVHEAKDASAGTEYDGQIQIEVGGHMDLSENSRIHGHIAMEAYEITPGTTEAENLEASVNYTQYKKITDNNVNVFTTVGLSYSDGEIKPANVDIKSFDAPITIGVEAGVKDW